MRTRPTLTWTATGDPLPRTTSLTPLVDLLRPGRALVLSGAGLSTGSGIPDYRGAEGSLRKHTPMTYQDFTASAEGRRRYWARAHVGWRAMRRAEPNDGHRAVAALQRAGLVDAVITQNVDGLHQDGGATDVVELHGSLYRVICLDCGATTDRAEHDARLREANPGFTATADRVNPDGDADLPAEAVAGFRVVDCARCGGVLKPDVVFFGENVPPERVRHCYDLVDAADTLLVLGSSLTVMSGLRFVRHAAKSGKPVAILNRGVTRGDDRAAVRVDRELGQALGELVDLLGAG
ncbi:NAD-dependent protein deacetylase [Actinosynnema pretiosum subsp. pretiosum]|uniref:NAD-dependent protein deacetylase n=2 Tax=Actinosynnema TaxID=40566 RepID=C6WFH5_ACTMD|nr:NAD-dependent protein deacetylase [Actinosynnema mirum]ACU35910.1 Silent information regulator protein Sir2 [Actinosynnema mirum DSM 43827]AXX29334.1 NAD-dependent protein deacetylase of SIR2 family [Actinosynnema pretiosum subsp. pretiosum]QUF06416.1 NAD-dependent protein deacetylase [Actinosynnema pretiosum subsp. pretiosum]